MEKRKLQNINHIKEALGAEVCIYFDNEQMTRVPLTLLQYEIIVKALGFTVQNGYVACYTDKKLKEIKPSEEG